MKRNVLVLGLCVVAALFIALKFNAMRNENRSLSRALAESTETVVLKEGLLQRRAVELDSVRSLLNEKTRENDDLKEALDKQGAELVSYTEVSVRWKKKYEALLRSTQTEVPPENPDGVPRLRVDFSDRVGPFSVAGHTLTSPPEAKVSVEQVDPIKLAVSLVQGRDGTWSSLVSVAGDDPSLYEVDVTLSAVDRELESVDWRDKLSVDMHVGVYDTPSLGVGVRYGAGVSVGPSCHAFSSDGSVAWSCGASVSWRPFDR